MWTQNRFHKKIGFVADMFSCKSFIARKYQSYFSALYPHVILSSIYLSSELQEYSSAPTAITMYSELEFQVGEVSWLPISHLWLPLQRAIFKFKSQTSAVGFQFIQWVLFIKKKRHYRLRSFPKETRPSLFAAHPRWDPDTPTTVAGFGLSRPQSMTASPHFSGQADFLPSFILRFATKTRNRPIQSAPDLASGHIWKPSGCPGWFWQATTRLK